MALPAETTVEIAFGEKSFDSTRLASAVNWTDVTADVRKATWSTSTRSNQFDVFAAGKATIHLSSGDRDYDPFYASSPYVNEFKRGVPVRITSEHSATGYVQWFGFVRRWLPDLDGSFDAVTIVQAIDGLGILADYQLAAITSSYRGDTVAERLDRVCDTIGWPSAWRDFGNGGPQTSLTPTVWGQNAFTHCLDVVNAEGGFLYADRDGTLIHDSRMAIASEARQATSQVTISHDTTPTWLYGSLKLSGVGDNFRNLVRVSGESGTVQEIDNSTATDAVIAHNLLDAPIETDTAALALAQFWADLYGTEVAHPAGCKVLISSSQTDLHTELVQRRIRDHVTVEADPAGAGADITHGCFIDGIRGTVDSSKLELEYVFSSQDAYDNNLAQAPSTYLLIGDATDGKVDTDRVGY